VGSPAAELRQRQNGRSRGVETRRREWREIMGVIRVVGEAYAPKAPSRSRSGVATDGGPRISRDTMTCGWGQTIRLVEPS